MLYFYDRVLVFRQDADLIWGRKQRSSIVSLVYTIMHASMALYILLQLCPSSNISCEVSLAICECDGRKLNYALCIPIDSTGCDDYIEHCHLFCIPVSGWYEP